MSEYWTTLKMGASFGTLEIRNQFFIRISLSLGTAGMKVITNGRMFLDVFVLFFKALFRDQKATSASVLSTSSCGG